jgi:hypothetical protein
MRTFCGCTSPWQTTDSDCRATACQPDNSSAAVRQHLNVFAADHTSLRSNIEVIADPQPTRVSAPGKRDVCGNRVRRKTVQYRYSIAKLAQPGRAQIVEAALPVDPFLHRDLKCIDHHGIGERQDDRKPLTEQPLRLVCMASLARWLECGGV